MESLLNVEVAMQLGDEREATLRREMTPTPGPRMRSIRRWLGRALVQMGTWLAGEDATWSRGLHAAFTLRAQSAGSLSSAGPRHD
jgi:hypothetical protein